MSKLTPEQVKAYMDAKGMGCPFCEEEERIAEDTLAGDQIVFGSLAKVRMSCFACGADWTAVYTISGVDTGSL